MSVLIPPDLSANNAKKLGMIADGVTNNFPLLIAAIAQAVASGSNFLFVPPGSYNFILPVGSSIMLPANFRLYGMAGLGTTFKIDPSSWTGVSGGTTLIFMKYNTGCVVSGIHFDGQKNLTNSGNATSYGLAFLSRTNETDSDNLFQDLIFENQLSGAAALECFCIASGLSSQRQKYVRVDCRNGNGSGISINGQFQTTLANPGTYYPQDIDVIDCRGTNMLWQGLTFYGAQFCRVVNFYGASCGSAGVYGGAAINMEWCNDISITAGTMENCQGPGINMFGWCDNIRLNGLAIRNNNQLDYNNLAEITTRRGGWYTVGFSPSSRINIYGVIQNLWIENCFVTPKTTGNYKNHLHVECDYAATYPNASASQPVRVHLNQRDASQWRMSNLGPSVYSYTSGVNGATWRPGETISTGNTRHNGGYLLTCTTGGVTGTGIGPQPTATGAVAAVDGTVYWTATSLSVDQNNIGAQWAQNTNYAFNDIRCNCGFSYRVTAPSTIPGTATSGTGNGPHGTVIGGTETDGGLTWTCEGPVTTSTQVLGAYVPKINDAWTPGIHIDTLSSAAPSIATQVANWTATGITLASYTGGGDLSGVAQTLTTTATSSAATAGVNIKDARWLTPGSYIAIIRYKSVDGSKDWHFCARAMGPAYDSTYGSNQFDLQLAAPIGDTTNWYEAHIPFTVPSTSCAQATVYYAGASTGAVLAIDSINVIPLRENNFRNAEVTLGGRKIYNGATPQNADLELGDRLLSALGAAPDQVCTTAGSYGNLNGATTLTMGQTSSIGTLSQVDPTYRPGMWLTIPGAGSSGAAAVKRIAYVNGTTIYTNSNTSGSSAVTAVSPTVLAPAFTSLPAPAQLPTVYTGLVAHAGGGQASATQLNIGWNRFSTVATAADSARLPSATVGAEVRVTNGGGASMAVFPASGEKIYPNATNASVNVGSTSNTLYYCEVAGEWWAK